MIEAMSHVGVWVHDQDEAKAFYTEKLGFEVREDATLEDFGGYRWLTVSSAACGRPSASPTSPGGSRRADRTSPPDAREPP